MAPRQVAKQKKVDKAEDRAKITIVFHEDTADEKLYPLYPDEVTPRIELELYHATKLSVSEEIRPASWTRPVLASVVFLSERVAGKSVTWDQVANNTPWPGEVGVRFGEPVGDLAPKAPASD